MQTELKDNWTKTLRGIITAGTAECKNFNGGDINALSKRELVKVKENRKGKFVTATAKGRKLVN